MSVYPYQICTLRLFIVDVLVAPLCPGVGNVDNQVLQPSLWFNGRRHLILCILKLSNRVKY